jgi:CRISPR-associated protein Csb1
VALWKIDHLLKTPFRYRSGCHLECVSLTQGSSNIKIDVNLKKAIDKGAFRTADEDIVTDIYWPTEELYREGEEDTGTPGIPDESDLDQENDENV